MLELDVSAFQHVVDAAVEDCRRRVTEEIQEMIRQGRAKAEAEMLEKKRCHETLTHILECKPVTQSSEILLSDILQVQIDGQVVKLHAAVLHSFPYFATRLNGTWSENNILELRLPPPCKLEDFLLMMRRAYSSSRLSFEDLGSCLRAALIASMLLADDCILAEIAASLSDLVKTQKDAKVLQAFVREHQLPEIISQTVIAEEPAQMDADNFQAMVSEAVRTTDERVRRFVVTIISAQHQLEQALWTALDCFQYAPDLPIGICWWMEVVMEHATVDTTVKLLQAMSKSSMSRKWQHGGCVPCGSSSQYYPPMSEDLKKQIGEAYIRYVRAHPLPSVVKIGVSEPSDVLAFGNIKNGCQILAEVLKLVDATEIRQQILSLSADGIRSLLSVEVLGAMSLQNKRAVCPRLASQVTLLCPAVVDEVRNVLSEYQLCRAMVRLSTSPSGAGM